MLQSGLRLRQRLNLLFLMHITVYFRSLVYQPAFKLAFESNERPLLRYPHYETRLVRRSTEISLLFEKDSLVSNASVDPKHFTNNHILFRALDTAETFYGISAVKFRVKRF